MNMNLSKNKAETSSARFEDLKSRANECYKRNELHKSAQLYNQVLLIDNLSNEQKAIVHSNRSLVYLKLYEAINRRDRDFLFKSLVDAEQANELNPKWCKTWARLGQIYAELNEYEKCIHNYTKALELEPSNEHVKNLLAQAKTLNFEQKRLAHFDDSYAPKTTEERTEEEFKKIADRLGQENTDRFKHTFERTKQDLIKSDKSLEYVWLGHEHRDGSSTCKQSYELAAKYYAKAAKMDNAEAMYNLALMHKHGNGVKLDFELAINLFKQAASQPAFKRLIGFADAPNVGVAESEHMLGLLYHQGIYVAKNIEQAVKYYERAVEHGSAHAANNLGLIFMNGDGVDMDLERAQVLFLYSQKKGSLEAITNLVFVYLAKGDPEQALLWHNRDLKASPILATQRHEQIMMEISDLRARKSQFDKELVESLINLKCDLNEDPCYPHSIRSQPYDEKMLAEKAEQGSATAKKMLDAIRLFNQALDQFSQNKGADLASIICKMAQALQIESLVCLRPMDVQNKLLKQLEKVVDENLGKKRCELDLNARICLMYFNMSKYAQNLQFINKSIEKYPHCTRMYELKASMHIFLKQFKMGIKQYDYVLSKEPHNSLSTYLRAAALKNSSCFKDALKDYERFLSICPSDARKVPEAHYSIGFCKPYQNNIYLA
ncbi:TPR repeat [Brachionus plicatilis]|uniref:TPR repeat n=1 Tax=Brachionus plicatilis TaxID=10195 RepID=A0A3M7Q8T9_BRAPC|nr:TPR repeat [Brachionus plicatilis]